MKPEIALSTALLLAEDFGGNGLTTEQQIKRAAVRLSNLGPIGTEAKVCEDIADRQLLGIAKYGQTVAANPLPLKAWLQHQYEELIDAAVYAKRAIEEIDAKEGNPNG